MFLDKKKGQKEIKNILNFVESRLMGKSVDTPEISSEIHKEVLNIFLNLIENGKENKKLLLQLLDESSELSNFDVEISFVSDKMKDLAGELSQFSTSNMAIVEETTAGMNQVKEAIENSTSILENITEKSDQLMKNDEENRNQVKKVVEIKDTVISDSDIMSKKISTLEEISLKVDEMVEGVGSIAEQTNLLALNASIEAARAGEHGKGFAVVAEEIRKLAEDTKDKLSDMRLFTDNIREATREGSVSVQNTIESMATMSEKIGAVDETFKESAKSLDYTMHGVSELAGMMEEINASSSEIAQAMETISEDSEKINNMASELLNDSDKTKKASNNLSDIDSDITNTVGSLIKIMNKGTHPIYNKDFSEALDKTIKKHQNWIEKLREMVESSELKPLQTDGDKCKFGHFYNSLYVEHPKLKDDWLRIDPIHKKLHSNGAIVRNYISEGNLDAARKSFNETVKLSEDIIDIFRDMSAKAVEMDKEGDYIFKVKIEE